MHLIRKPYMGECNQETSTALLDYFYDAGGNFIDTANNYQNEESETWIGEWMEQRGVRDQMVLATKFTISFSAYQGFEHGRQHVNTGGNSAKSLRVSFEASLKKLKTSYIDILYLHFWDYTSSIEEVMLALNDLVRAGKVLYLGVSDTPAWIVSKANQYARDHGLRPFVIYQGLWNCAARDFERDILPMCRAEGMALAPWKAVGGGQFKTKAEAEATTHLRHRPTEKESKMSEALEKIANRKGTVMTSVALAYLMHKSPYVFPIVGGRKLEHLKANVEALGLVLDDQDMKEIEDASEFDVGFPQNFLGGRAGENMLMKMMGVLDIVEDQKAIIPKTGGK